MDRYSLDRIYQAYFKDVYRYLFSLCLNHHTTQDLAQETFYRAYLHLEICKDEKVKPWLFRVAYNVFIDWKRKDNRSLVLDNSFFHHLSDSHTPEEQMLRLEQINEMRSIISSLPVHQKQAILLHDFGGLTYQESADIMDVRLSQFKILLFRARQKLRRHNERTE
ncbi:sigma-70 family RNA polymerase sigma factor [Paenibacillus sp. GbtcB18]|uniref:sigma-70 family RNA polymerase sigma factor n=1 Tax=Paenibacillus sp. GbtcB18 TaxID=2824763 RepID=UPI001C2FD13B|nr:sigma-70 family RNA polymerase sigma factor [Paenibacillus sp. GbtcB18]